ncbi:MULTISPECIES: hypothetical protein [unclassified Rhodococcus (in: high G+C Gram-positive bacteria)]|uniref:hypothetical protein n=1 Tax=unclassified Rhodococcus (in: high G+C Gram-positive bacteria) TaxID=192944 RepID=UPI0018DB1B69|nr:hypothetical protein [Rhodococcus sp. YL-1]
MPNSDRQLDVADGGRVDLEHVARFVVAPELVEIDDLTAQDRRQLPEHWLHALAGDRAWRLAEVLKRWNNFGRPIMSDTYTTITVLRTATASSRPTLRPELSSRYASDIRSNIRP